MCILIAKPKGVKAPSIETLKTCWTNNPDGAGVSWVEGHEVMLKKGFMKWQDFKDFIANTDIEHVPAIIHFRIATHGTVKPENTHPFHVNKDIIAGHNGILSVKNEGDWTDSETFFRRICAPILKTFSLESEVFKKVIDAMIGTSKLAFLTRKGELKTFGTFTEDEGIFYSNTTYKATRYDYGGYGTWDYKDYDNRKRNIGIIPQKGWRDTFIAIPTSAVGKIFQVGRFLYRIAMEGNKLYILSNDYDMFRGMQPKEKYGYKNSLISEEIIGDFAIFKMWTNKDTLAEIGAEVDKSLKSKPTAVKYVKKVDDDSVIYVIDVLSEQRAWNQMTMNGEWDMQTWATECECIMEAAGICYSEADGLLNDYVDMIKEEVGMEV